ncbi:MAG: hypothetical protein ACOYK9_00520 [Chlamydiia bacterium]
MDIILSENNISNFLFASLPKIQKVTLRVEILRALMVAAGPTPLSEAHLTILSTLTNKKNIAVFAEYFVDDESLTLLQNCLALTPSEERLDLKCLYTLILHSVSQEKVSPAVMLKFIRTAIRKGVLNQLSSTEALDFFVVYNEIGGIPDSDQLTRYMERVDFSELRTPHLHYLVEQMIREGKRSRDYDAYAVKLLIAVMHRKDCVEESLSLIQWIYQQSSYAPEDLGPLIDHIVTHDVTNAEIASALMQLIDHYEGAIFFPGHGKQANLAFLSIVSKMANRSQLIERMLPHLHIFQGVIDEVKEDDLVRIAGGIVSQLSLFSTEDLGPIKGCFPYFYDLLKKRRGFATSLIESLMMGYEVFSKDSGLNYSLDEMVRGLKNSEALNFIIIHSRKIREQYRTGLEQLSYMQIFQKELEKLESFEMQPLLDSLKIYPYIDRERAIDFLEKSQLSLINQEKYLFLPKRAHRDLLQAIKILEQVYKQSGDEEIKKNACLVMQYVLETQLIILRFSPGKPCIDLDLIQNILDKYLKKINPEEFIEICGHVFEAFASQLNLHPKEMHDQSESFIRFNQNFMFPIIQEVELDITSNLRALFHFYNEAKRLMIPCFIIEAGKLLVMRLSAAAKDNDKKKEMLQFKEEIQIQCIPVMVSLLDQYSKEAFLLARAMMENLQLVYETCCPKIDERLLNEAILYDLTPQNLGQMVPVILQLAEQQSTKLQKITFYFRLGIRLRSILLEEGGLQDEKCIEGINRLIYTQMKPLLLDPDLTIAEKMLATKFFVNIYAPFSYAFLKGADVGVAKGGSQLEIHDLLIKVSIERIVDFLDFIPPFGAGVFEVFQKVLPQLSQLITCGFSRFITDKVGKGSKGGKREQIAAMESLRNLFVTSFAILSEENIELIPITEACYKYIAAVDLEINRMDRDPSHVEKNLDVNIFFKQHLLQLTIGCGLVDLASAIYKDVDSFKFFFINFQAYLESQKILSDQYMDSIFKKFSPWIEESIKIHYLEASSPRLIQETVKRFRAKQFFQMEEK